jgi:hypothetical protein
MSAGLDASEIDGPSLAGKSFWTNPQFVSVAPINLATVSTGDIVAAFPFAQGINLTDARETNS